MKKFFTIVSLQKDIGESGLKNNHYEAVGNSLLNMDGVTSYPIVPVINGYANKGEEIRVFAIVSNPEYMEDNYQVLNRQVQEVCDRKGILLPNGVEKIIISNEQTVNDHINSFISLLPYFGEDDELFGCLTYGTKVNTITLLMAIQYAYRIKKNSSIKCLVYGDYNRMEGSAKLYDVTALVQMDELVCTLADKKIENPEELLRMIAET